MIDATAALLTAYIQFFAALQYNGKALPVYAIAAPDTAAAPYIILGPWVATPDNTKADFGQTGEIVLDIVTRFAGNNRSYKPAADIAALITQALKPTTTAEVLTVQGFQSWNTRIIKTDWLTLVSATDTVVRHLLTVEHSFSQLSTP